MLDMKDITRWSEHIKFIFEWKKYIRSESSKQVKSFFHEKINFIKKKLDEKQRNDVSDIFTSDDMENNSLASRM